MPIPTLRIKKEGVTPMDVVGTEKMKELEDIMKETRHFYMNPVAPSPTAARNVADDTSGDDDQPDPALACASRTLSKHGPFERLCGINHQFFPFFRQLRDTSAEPIAGAHFAGASCSRHRNTFTPSHS